MRWVKRLGIALAALILLSSVCVGWLVGTTSGLRAALALSPQLEVETASGRLLGPFSLAGVVVDSDAARIQIDTVNIDWSPSALINRELRLRSISIDTVAIARKPDSGTRRDPREAVRNAVERLQLPVAVIVDAATAKNVSMATVSGASSDPHDVEFVGGLKGGVLSIDQLAVAGTQLTAELSGTIDPTPGTSVSLTSEWRITAFKGESAVSGSATVAGEFDRLVLRADVSQPAAVTVNGRFDGLRTGDYALQLQAALEDITPQDFKDTLPVGTVGAEVGVVSDLEQIEVSLDVRLTDSVLPPTRLTGSVLGKDNRISFDALRLTNEDGDFTLEGELLPAEDYTWRLRAQSDRFSVARYVAQSQTLSIDGEFRMEGGLHHAEMHWSGHLADDTYGRWHTNAALDIDSERVEVQSLQVRATDDAYLGIAGSAVVSGILRPHPDGIDQLDIELSAQVTDVEWPVSAEAQVRIESADLSLVGTPNDYDVASRGRIVAPSVGPVSFSLVADGDTESLNIKPLDADLLTGRLSAEGAIQWRDGIDWRSDLKFAQLDLSAIDADLVGELSAEVRARGRVEQGKIAADIQVDHVDGHLAGLPVAADGSIEVKDNAVIIQAFELRQGDNTASIRGRMGESIAVDWQVAVDDLTSLLPGVAQGRLAGEGRVLGSLSSPRITGELALAAMSIGDAALENTRVVIDVQPLSDAPSSVIVNAKAILVAEDITLEDAAVKISGNVSRQLVEIDLRDGGQSHLTATISGSVSDNTWSFTSDLATLEMAPDLVWQQQQAWSGKVTAESIEIGDACWINRQQRLCLSLSRLSKASAPTRLDAELIVENVELSMLDPYVDPASIAFHGSVNGEVIAATTDDQRLKVSGMLMSETGSIDISNEDDSVSRLQYRQFIATVKQEEGLRLSMSAKLGDDGYLEGEAVVDVPSVLDVTKSTKVAGSIDLALASLANLPIKALQRTSPTGALAVSGQVSGTLDAPRIALEANLRNAGFDVPEAGSRLTDIDVDAKTVDEKTVALSARTKAGAGSIQVDGKIALESIDDLTLSLTVVGNNAEVVSLREATVTISPELSITARNNEVDVEGTVAIDQTRIDIQSAVSTVQISPDVVLAPTNGDIQSDESARKRPPLLTLASRIEIDFGDDAQIKAFGFAGRLTGTPVISQTREGLVTASGDINVVDGAYEIYGQSVPITLGVLSYADTDIDNPQLNIEASRTVDDVNAGVRLQGTARKPQFAFFSEPPLEDSDVLSYLLFERPISELSPADAIVLVRAAAAARNPNARGNGANLVKRISDSLAGAFGLKDLNIGVNTLDGETAVVVGSQLSSRLYLGYAVGVFDAASRFILNYRLNDRWSIESAVGGESGADLKYQIER